MPYAKRTDANQIEIVFGLRRIPGVVVHVTSGVGQGFSDLIVSYKGRIWFMEIKDGSKPPSKRKLRPAQIEFQTRFADHYVVVTSLSDALRALGIT